MDEETARTLITTTQQLRVHWSDNITKHFGYAIITFSAIWSYLLKEYISGRTHNVILIVAAATITSIFLSLWRVNTRIMDGGIAGLYGDFIHYEKILKVPDNIATLEYLRRHVFHNIEVKSEFDKLNHEDKVKVVNSLSASKKIGDRGHLVIDKFVAFYIFLSIVFTILYIDSYS